MAALKIQIQISPDENEQFAAHLRDLASSGHLPQQLDVTVKNPKPPVGGFALTIPPEVTVALLTAVATASASEVIKTIWSELREFLKTRRQQKPSEKPIVIVIDGQRLTFKAEDMPANAP